MTNYFKLNSASVLDEGNVGYLMSDTLQETEELEGTAPNTCVRHLPATIGRTTGWAEAVLSEQDAFRPVAVDVSRLPNIFMATPQIRERGIQWVCITTEKTTQQPHVSCLRPYPLLTKKQEPFSVDSPEIVNIVNSLLRYELTRVSVTSQSIEETTTEKVNEIITAECSEFCKSHDILETLSECLDQVKRNFVSTQKVQAELRCFYDDEELDNESHVEIEVKIKSSREIAENSYDNWLDWFVKKVPDTKRNFFILTIDRV